MTEIAMLGRLGYMNYTVKFKCQDCYAQIEIQNEKPPWVGHDQKLIDEARAFVEANKGKRFPLFVTDERPELPPLVVTELAGFGTTELVLSSDAHARWIECPACGGRADPVDESADD